MAKLREFQIARPIYLVAGVQWMTEREVGNEVRDVGDWWIDHIEPEVGHNKAL